MSHPEYGRVRKQQFHDRLGILHHRYLHRKLKERFPATFNTRWTRRHWLHASLFATLGALLATIVPGFSSQLQPTSPLSATLPLQLPPLTVRAPGDVEGGYWDVVQIERGQTLGQLFEKVGAPAATMHRILENPANREALTRLRPGAELAFRRDEHGALRGFRFDRSPTERVELDLLGEAIHEKVLERATTTRLGRDQRRDRPFAVRRGAQGRAEPRCHRGDDRRDLQVRHRLQGRAAGRPLQRGGRGDLARGRTGRHRPDPRRHLQHRRQGLYRLPFRAQRQDRVLHRRRPAAEEELHPHADSLCAPVLELRRAPAPGAGQDAHAQGRGLRRRHRHADHGRRRRARAVRRPAARLWQRGDPRPRPRPHHAVRAHVALRQGAQGPAGRTGHGDRLRRLHRPWPQARTCTTNSGSTACTATRCR